MCIGQKGLPLSYITAVRPLYKRQLLLLDLFWAKQSLGDWLFQGDWRKTVQQFLTRGLGMVAKIRNPQSWVTLVPTFSLLLVFSSSSREN